MKLSPRQARALELIQAQTIMSKAELNGSHDVADSTVRSLERRGLVELTYHGGHQTWSAYGRPLQHRHYTVRPTTSTEGDTP